MMYKLVTFLEGQAFGVSARISEKFGWPTMNVRLFFVYASFITFGSPVIIYLGLAFIMKFRKYVRQRRNPVWYF